MNGEAAGKTSTDRTVPGKQPDAESQPPSPDKLLVQQYQAELASRERLATAAEKEIGRCWTAYKWAAGIIAAAIVSATAVLGVLGYKTASEIRNDARSAARSEVDKVRGEVAKEIAKQFETNSVQKMVFDAAKERIDTVADPMIRSNISALVSRLKKDLLVTLDETRTQQATQFEELNRSVSNSLTTESNLQSVMADAKKGVDRLEEVTAFAVTVVLADHDDRAAYERLKRSAEDPAGKDRDAALTAYRSILGNYSGPPSSWTQVPWDKIPDGTNRYSWDMDRIVAIWIESLPSGTRFPRSSQRTLLTSLGAVQTSPRSSACPSRGTLA